MLIEFPGQMFLLDRFFDGTFFTYGIEVMSFADRDQEDRIDPMIYVFPRMTKCTFHKFGTSGNIEKHDALCILPLNIVNEKIYIFIWFWLLLLGKYIHYWDTQTFTPFSPFTQTRLESIFGTEK